MQNESDYKKIQKKKEYGRNREKHNNSITHEMKPVYYPSVYKSQIREPKIIRYRLQYEL